MSNSRYKFFDLLLNLHSHSFRCKLKVRAGPLKIADASGKIVTINTTPRTGADNKQLHAVGKTYGVIKLVADHPHWSDNGH